mmetsp:Transcript_17911/g.58839  ORF Transcript_17911/g.58839 Transcript_17911/m.58839 type:complete len:115 (-) Transcript_17911:307-651(-)
MARPWCGSGKRLLHIMWHITAASPSCVWAAKAVPYADDKLVFLRGTALNRAHVYVHKHLSVVYVRPRRVGCFAAQGTGVEALLYDGSSLSINQVHAKEASYLAGVTFFQQHVCC